MSYLKTDEQIRRENDEALHVALTPFRFIYRIMAMFGLLTMALAWGLICWCGWIVDVGPRSERARQAAIADMNYASSFEGDGAWTLDLEFDFRNRPSWWDIRNNHADDPWASPDHFRVTDRLIYPHVDLETAEHKYRDTIVPFTTSEIGGTMANHGIPFCQLGHAGLNDTGLGTWSERGNPRFLLNRKAGRMHRDYETVAMMTAALRSALAHLRAGQTLASEGGPDETSPEDSFCNAEGVIPGKLKPDQVAAYRAATYQVHLPDAPVLWVRYAYFGIDEAQTQEPDDPIVKRQYQWRLGGAEIVGMCLDDNCRDETALNFQTTYLDDLFAQEPPLGPAQLDAEQALLQTATMDFWLQEARANGITDVKLLYAMHDEAEKDLQTVLTKVY